MRGVRYRSISFVISMLRTLFRNGPIATPFSSTTCALFPMQWGVGGILCRFGATHYPLTTGHFLFFSTTYNSGNLQPFCFYNVATVGWGGRGAFRNFEFRFSSFRFPRPGSQRARITPPAWPRGRLRYVPNMCRELPQWRPAGFCLDGNVQKLNDLRLGE